MSANATRRWLVQDREIEFHGLPLLMGIVNVTPDSFSDGGKFAETRDAIEHAIQLVEDGADILDIGGEIDPTCAKPVSLDDELSRVIPVVQQLASRVSVPISIDTMKADVAAQALAHGASIVNDISGRTFDPRMVKTCRESNAGIVCMHMQGTPATMQQNPRYDDVVKEICEYLSLRLQNLEEQGISAERVVVDPGIGFGKTADHNIEILSHIKQFHELGRPVLIGHSRKRFLKALLGRTVEPDGGGLGVSIALAMQSVDILRVHDVRETRNALQAWQAIHDRTQ